MVRPSKIGLFFSDVQDNVGHAFVNTVAKNKSKYTIEEYSDAVRACSLQDIIGRPATDDFIRYVENNMIPNCPVTKSDILRAEDIFGKNIGTLKERIRAIANQLPFEAYPHRLIVEMVYNVIFWINIFPHKDGIHDYISPHMNITGLRIDHKKHCKLEFGTYVHVHKEHDNSLMPRTTGAIALRPTGNSQGSHYFLNLNSGRSIVQNHWTTLPMPAEVIHNVH